MKPASNYRRQRALRETHAQLLADIDYIADAANQERKAPQRRANAIVAAAEEALVEVGAKWRDSQGGPQNNIFFRALSERLRRIITFYRPHATVIKANGEKWAYRIVDFEALSFHRLRPYFTASAVDEAIKTGIRLGLRDVPGLEIYQEFQEEPWNE